MGELGKLGKLQRHTHIHTDALSVPSSRLYVAHTLETIVKSLFVCDRVRNIT